MGPAIRVRGSGGLVTAEALGAAARVEPDGEPGAGRAVVENNGVPLSTGEGTLAAGVGQASEGRAPIGGHRCAGDVDRTIVAATLVVVGDDHLVRVVRVSPSECLRLGKVWECLVAKCTYIDIM